MIDHKRAMAIEKSKWVRSQNGVIFGVCQGLGERFDLAPWLLRLILIGVVFVFGTGILVYFVLSAALPREDRLQFASDKRILGVCARLAEHFDIDVGLTRAAAIFLGIASFGATLVGYVVLYFLIPERPSAARMIGRAS